MSSNLDEAQVEIVTVDYIRELGYEHIHGPVIAPYGKAPERQDYGQVVLTRRLRDALVRINPDVPIDAIEDALRQVTRADSPSLIVNNRAFHKMLSDGVDVSWRDDGQERHGKVWLVERDPAKLDDNEFLVVNQFTVIEGGGASPAGRGGGEGVGAHRRPDIVVFVNELECRSPATCPTRRIE